MRCGLIVNPIAGMGGSVGLKGTDGADILQQSVRLGAQPRAPERAARALLELMRLRDHLKLITCHGRMGESAAAASGFGPVLIGEKTTRATTSADTRTAAREMLERGVDLLLFAGGDGTARDIFHAVGSKQVVLGIPAGVKIHSAVYAQNPQKAGELAALFLDGRVKRVIEADVLDINEEDYRRDSLSASLYGYLKIPFKRSHVQNMKSGSPDSEHYYQEAIACDVLENMTEDVHYIIGPGTTTRPIMQKLGLEFTLLGMDLIYRRQLIGKDLNEKTLSKMLKDQRIKVIITPIGGQGYVFGRGNQQLSPELLRQIGRENIQIIATKRKIHALHGRPLLVDTGDEAADRWLSGYYKIITGYHEHIIYKVSS